MARPSIRHVPATKAYCSGTSIHPPCSGNQGLLAPSNHRHMLRAPPIRAPPIQLCFSRVRRCQTAPALPTKWQPVGPESCWGSADAAQGRYVNPTNACQSFQPHPSTFAFSGFEGAKRHRLCRPSGNPLGLNPAGVLLFRMRAHRRGWRL